MLTYLNNKLKHRSFIFTSLLILILSFFLMVYFTNQSLWLNLIIIPILAAFFWLNTLAGSTLLILSLILLWLTGLRIFDASHRLEVWSNLPLILIVLLPVSLVFSRLNKTKRDYETKIKDANIDFQKSVKIHKQKVLRHKTNKKKINRYYLLNRISRIFGSQIELEKLGQVIIDEVRNIIAENSYIYMISYDFCQSNTPITYVWPQGITKINRLSDQFSTWVFKHKTSLLIVDTHKDFRFEKKGLAARFRSLMLAPLTSEGEVRGILRVESSSHDEFGTDDLRFFTILADLASLAAESAALYQLTEKMAISDGLTGLYLRRFFNQHFSEELNRFKKDNIPFSLLILDIDHFKSINDKYGHLAGDKILRDIAKVLKAEARLPDILCRYGGEEFCLLLPNTDIKGAKVMAERIRKRVAKSIFEFQAEKIKITVSGGIGECPKHGKNISGLIKAADTALYQAKEQGRNRMLVAGE